MKSLLTLRDMKTKGGNRYEYKCNYYDVYRLHRIMGRSRSFPRNHDEK